MADQHGIVHRHHDHFLDADHRGQRPVGADVGIAHMVDLDRPLGDVAGAVGLADIEQRVPGAEVGPAELGRHDPAFVGALHDGVVDRLGRRLGEGIGIEEHRRTGLLGLGDGFLGGSGHGGLEAGHFGEQQLGREQEVAAVPQQALGDVAQRRLGIGLLDEGRDLLHRADALAARPDIAVVGLGLGRRDAEGDDAALLHGRQALAAGVAEFLGADHQVVRRQGQHGLGALVAGIGRGGGHRRSRIAPRRLDQDVDFHADILGLLLGHEAVGVVGGDHRPGEQAACRRRAPGSAGRSIACPGAARTAWACSRATAATGACRSLQPG